jgi:hypothetical protein
MLLKIGVLLMLASVVPWIALPIAAWLANGRIESGVVSGPLHCSRSPLLGRGAARGKGCLADREAGGLAPRAAGTSPEAALTWNSREVS